MTEANEPSYYEVALTNRQVLVSFIVLLGCVLSAFVFGVWVGKEGSDPALGPVAATESPQEMAKLEELQFFSDSEDAAEDASRPASDADDSTDSQPATDLDKPDLSELFDSPRDTTLAADVGSDRQGSSNPPPAAPPPSVTSPPPPRQSSPPPASPPPPAKAQAEPVRSNPATDSAGTSAPAAEGFIVQVFSSHDEDQAEKVLAQMRRGGYRAFLSPLQAAGSREMYRVRLGPYEQRPPADAAAKEVTRKYKLETWVTAASN